MTLLKADYQNREKYIYGLAKPYDLFDKVRDIHMNLIESPLGKYSTFFWNSIQKSWNIFD